MVSRWVIQMYYRGLWVSARTFVQLDGTFHCRIYIRRTPTTALIAAVVQGLIVGLVASKSLTEVLAVSMTKVFAVSKSMVTFVFVLQCHVFKPAYLQLHVRIKVHGGWG